MQEFDIKIFMKIYLNNKDFKIDYDNDYLIRIKKKIKNENISNIL